MTLRKRIGPKGEQKWKDALSLRTNNITKTKKQKKLECGRKADMETYNANAKVGQNETHFWPMVVALVVRMVDRMVVLVVKVSRSGAAAKL